MTINTGLSKADRKEVSQDLKEILATSYMLSTKAQKFHWNVESELFDQLHNRFEELYNQLAGLNDEIAERIRALGFMSPGSLSKFEELSQISESSKTGKESQEMVSILLNDLETLISLMRKTSISASDVQDKATDDLLSANIREFEKTAWMLRSQLQ